MSDVATLFVDLLLPVPIAQRFTYRVPAALNERVADGLRVIAPFGQRRILTGIIASVHHQPPKEREAKYILEVLDDRPAIHPVQFKLYEWIASYYLCTTGEVLNAALPSGLKLSSESMIQLHPAFNLDESPFEFSEKERMLVLHLSEAPLSYSEAAKLLEIKSLYAILRSLSAKEAIILFEEVRDKYKPKTESRIRLKKELTEKSKLEEIFARVAAKPKQEAILLKYLQLVPVFQEPTLNETGVAKTDLTGEDLSASSLQTLIGNGVFESFDVIVPRFGFPEARHQTPLLLTEKQEATRQSISQAFDSVGGALLFGITGSGKTEVYIDLMRKALESGTQVLYLLPEIALTAQIVQRLLRVFGSEMGVYHSRFSDNERVEVWNGVLDGTFRLVVGVRSAVFLPFDNLGLIIVDEEHDPSYKQHDPAPRYHARDVAMVMAQQHHARILLGSATPSCESFYLSQTGKLGFVTLNERFGEAKLPDIEFADLSMERKQKTNKGEFSNKLLRSIKEAVDNKNQVILFQNRRGHSPLVECDDCGWVPKCINCAVSLTYHQYRHALICHYCGYREELPAACPSCQSKRILTLGYGTQRLEEELKIHLPDAHIGRMDLDTTRTRSAYESIISEFESGSTDVLVGTQMVTKGLDFDRVTLVGVFDADRIMHFPDFRSYERALQLMLQVSGRAGRRNQSGKVIIQTSNPKHPLFSFVVTHDVLGFLKGSLADREQHGYPPFTRLVAITVKHPDASKCKNAATQLADLIRKRIQRERVLGPGQPMVGRIRNEYLQSILVKIERNKGSLDEIKHFLVQCADTIRNEKDMRTVRIQFDVDPV